jgi:type II secretion system protein H
MNLKKNSSGVRHLNSGFTLIEIMVVVCIIGLIAAMSVPSIMSSVQKEGMRKAVSDVQDVCAEARAQAIFLHKPMAVVFHPAERRFEVADAPTDVIAAPVDSADFDSAPAKAPASGKVSAATLPDGIDFAMLDVNMQDFVQSEWVRVRFFPNGTSDEMTVVLHSNDAWRKITLEFATGMTEVSDMEK